MPVFDDETRKSDPGQPDVVMRAQEILDQHSDQSLIAAERQEGEDICAILEPLGLPPILTAAVHLYPVARASHLERKLLQKNGIPEIADLVDGLVQLGQFALPPDWKPGESLAVQQSEALRKMLLAVVSDARLVVVRIGEQVYRLRQAKSAPVAVQRSIAIETQEIYAPLANRLGIWQLKWELEDLAFRFLDPGTYRQIAKALNEKRGEREDFINEVKSKLQQELWKNGIHAEIAGRPKHIFSIWRKMQRKNSRSNKYLIFARFESS